MKKKKISKNQYQYFLTLVALGACGSLLANPEGLHLVSGDASSSNPARNILEITSGKKAIIEWDSFSIANHEVTRFIQQDSSSAVLNRVTGDMSKILGTLESNGKIFLINPKGILIGEGARIDTGSFIASTFDILNTDFLEGKDLLFSGDSDHAIVNLGTIRAAEGDVILLAHRIKNDGTITAEQGQVSLNSGHELLLQPDGSKVFIRPKISKNVSKEIGIENTGTIQAIEAHLKADGNLFAQAINHSGVIEATGIENRDGRIHLVAENSKVDVSGNMSASSMANGGQIHVIGSQINLLSNAKLDVSGLENGGEVLIGGDAHGENPNIPHASFTTMQENATIAADSLSKGNGGKVVLWADENTDFFGEITGKGGPLGGDGGFVEISSPNTLSFNGKVNLLAPLGKTGELLLDPGDISIGLGGTPTNLGGNSFCSIPSLPLPNVSTTIIDPTSLYNALLTCNVTLDTSNSGQDTRGVISIGLLAIPSTYTLTLRANSNINFFSIFQINPVGTSVNNDILVLEAGGNIQLVGVTNVLPALIQHLGNGGNISMTCDNLLLQGGVASLAQSIISLSSSASNLTITADRDVTIRGGIDTTGAGAGNSGISSSATSGSMSITAGNEILIVSNDAVTAISSSPGNLTLTAPIISLAGNGEAGSASQINVSGASDLTFNAGSVSIATSGNTLGSISAQNGDISGTVQNLTINPQGSQNNSFFATGTGNISLLSNQPDSTYVLAGDGTGMASMTTKAGTISLEFQGANSGLSLVGETSPAQIVRTGGGVPGNIQINETGSDDFLLINGIAGTFSSGLIQNQFGDIDITLTGTESTIAFGTTSSFSTSLLQTTTNPGNINIIQNNGRFVIEGGAGNPSQSAIQSTGQIQITGANCSLDIFGGSSKSEAFIQSTTDTIINVLSLSLSGGIGATSDAFIAPLSPSNVTITAPFLSLFGQSGTGSGQAYISNPGSTLTITSTAQLSLIGGSSTGVNTAFITGSDNINIFLGGLFMSAGSGSNAAVSITSTSGPILFTGVGPSALTIEGGDGANSSASISTPSIITFNTPNQSLSLIGGEGASAFASITSTTSPIAISCVNLELLGPQTGSGGGYASIATGLGAITIDASGFIELQAGNTSDTYAQINTQNGNIDIGQNIPSFGSLYLFGGGGSNSYAQIFTPIGNIEIGQTARSFGDLSLFGGDGLGAYSQIATSDGNIVTINSSGNVILDAGNSPFGNTASASISGVSTTGACNLTVTGSSLTLEGGSGTGDGVNQAYLQLGTSLGGNTIDVAITGAIEINASTGYGITNAFIQSLSTVVSPITISCESLFMQGALNPNPSGFANISTILGNINITATNTISMIGGVGQIAGSYALINNNNGGNVTISGASNILLEGGSGLDSDGAIFSSLVSGTGNISITGSSLTLVGGLSNTGTGRGRIGAITGGNITIDCPTGSGIISLVGGSGTRDNSVFIQATNGFIDLTGSTLSVVGGGGTGTTSATDSNALIFTSSAANPITINMTNEVKVSGAISPDMANSQRNSAFITTNSTGAASDITITCGNLDILGSSAGSGQGIAVISTDVGAVSIISGGHIQLIGGGSPVSFAEILTTEGAITLSASGNIRLKGGTGSFSQSQISRLGTTGNTTITAGSLTLTGGVGSSSFAQIGTNTPIAFPFTGTISFPTISGDVLVEGGSMGGYALIGHGSPTATTAGIHFIGDITLSSVAGNVYVSGGLLAPSFGQIGHINTTSNSSILSGNVTINALQDVTLVNTGSPGYALIGMGGQSNTATDSFTSIISMNANNVFLQSELSDDGYSVIGFLSPGSGIVTISSPTPSLTITASQNIIRQAFEPTSGPVAGIGSFVLSNNIASSATIANLTLSAGQNFSITPDNSPTPYAEGIDFVGTYFPPSSLASGSSSIMITTGRNFFFDEYLALLGNQGFLQNTNPNHITTSHPIEIQTGYGFFTSQGAGNTMSIVSSGTFSVNDPSNPLGDVSISNLVQSATGMEIIAGRNFILDSFAKLNNTTSGAINLVADNLNPTAPDFNSSVGFSLVTPATVTNQNNTGPIFIYSTTEFSTFIGDGRTPSINGNVFKHGTELVDTPTEDWGVYFPGGTLTSSTYRVFYKNLNPTPRPRPLTPSELALLKIIAFDHYEGGFLISQALYEQPEILDDYMFWAEAFSTSYDRKNYEKMRKIWGYRSSFDTILKQRYTLNRNKYFNFYELLLQRDVRNKR